MRSKTKGTVKTIKQNYFLYFRENGTNRQTYRIKILIVCPGKIRTNISINAATADGSKHNQMDESHELAMGAEECAKQIMDAIEKSKEEIFVGGKEILMVKIKRFFPRMFLRMIRKQSPYWFIVCLFARLPLLRIKVFFFE